MSSPSSLSGEQVGRGHDLAVEETLQTVGHYHVAIDCPDHVRLYFSRYPGLLPHVLTTIEKARQEFGDLAELTLTINDDPEAFDPYLKLYISLPTYGPDTLPRLNRIQEPLDEATADQEGFLLVTTDHRVVGS